MSSTISIQYDIDVKEEQEEHMKRTMLEGEYVQVFQLSDLAMEEEIENKKNALLEKDHVEDESTSLMSHNVDDDENNGTSNND
eukprot:8228744-Ditylum_brightwellii.AAC.1